MNEALQAILDYVRTPNTDYALLITGPWGCGKTHFWKHEVQSRLHQPQADGEKCRPLYATLYGCHDAKDIDTRLFLASHPHLQEKWAKRLTSVGGGFLNQLMKAFTRFEIPAIDLRWFINTKGAVLCFDDLERTRLSMREVLGYINTFVEHEGVKVVILCNEAAIAGEDDKDTYDVMKEKLVGASLAFRADLDVVFQTLINEYESRSPFHEFLSANAKLLRALFDRSETHNIRSLRRAMSALALIFDALSVSKIDPNAVGKQVIYAVAPASFEIHGRGVDPAKLSDILSADNMAIAGLVALSRSKDQAVKDDYGAEFAERYFCGFDLVEWRDPVGCPPICDFLVTGVLDRSSLESWARDLTKPPDEREQRIKRLTFDPKEMEDEEFAAATARTIEEVESGQIDNVAIYWHLFPSFEWFCNSGLTAMTAPELLTKFLDGLGKAKDSRRLTPDPGFRRRIDHPSLAPRTEHARELCARLVEINDDLLRRELSQRVKVAASRFKEDPGEFIEAITDREESGLLLAPVFQELDPTAVAEWILGLSNEQKLRFDSALFQRYRNGSPYPDFVTEASSLKKIRETLLSHARIADQATRPIPISAIVVKGIAERLEGVVNRLEQIRASANQTVDDGVLKDQANIKGTSEAMQDDV